MSKLPNFPDIPVVSISLSEAVLPSKLDVMVISMNSTDVDLLEFRSVTVRFAMRSIV